MQIFVLVTSLSALALAALILLIGGVMCGVAKKMKRRIDYRLVWIAALALSNLWIAACFYGHFFGRFNYEVKSWDFTSEQIPAAFDGYRIVQISDLHSSGWIGHERKLQRIIDEVNALQPDLICFTGDLADRIPGDHLPLCAILRQLKARDGVVAVLGNHDYHPYYYSDEDEREASAREITAFERESLGWTVLNNDHIILRRGNDSLAVLGCENQSVGIHPVIQRGNLQDAMSGTEGMMRILLTHDPTHWLAEVVGQTDIPLTLSGHTHAMQLRVFGISPMRVVGMLSDGLYAEGKQQLYINVGLGGSYRMRLGANPEVTLLTLRRPSSKKNID